MTDSVTRLRRAARRAERRLRVRAALQRLALLLPLPLAFATIALSVLKLGQFGWSTQRWVLASAALLSLITVGLTLRALFRRPPRWAGALTLDAYHGLGDRVTSALALLDTPAKERTGFVEAAIEDGIGVAGQLDPRKAVRIPIPRELGVSVALMVSLLMVAWLEVRVTRVLPPPPSFEPLVMSSDDLELFGEVGKKLAERSEDRESLAAIRRFNALIEDISSRRLDRKDAFERLSDLEAELSKSADIDREARDLGLEGLARELGNSGLAKSAAEALDQKRLADAEQALRELAERLKRKDHRPTKAEIERLRSAMERASQASGERTRALEERRRELVEEQKSLLKRKSDPKTEKGTQQKLEENQRKLERLDRDKARAERAKSEISDLDRELAKAAEDLRKDTEKAAEDIRRSADELGKVAKRATTEKEKRELLERLREMRELLRQQGQAGAERLRQMTRFGQRARGRAGQDQDSQGRGEGKGKGKGKPGRGQGPGGAELVEVPRIVQVPGRASGEGSGDSPEGKGDGADGSGREPGKSHDPNVLGDATALQGETRDVSAAGVDTGQGSASAEVIHGAAERGFVGKGYRNVYVDYQNVAEQSLEHDQIPPGYRFYVRRYFQLIRPRE